MKTRPAMSVVVALLFAISAIAPVAHAAPQHDKMKACNAEAKDKTGDERKAFMKECLSAKKPEEASALTPQQQKMKSCNAEAKAKAFKGDERKKFMSTCLKG